MLYLIDRYKFGIIAVLMTYVGIFMYTQISTSKYFYTIDVGDDSGRIVTEDEIPIKPENVEMPDNYDSEVLNMGDNVSDGRKVSDDKFYENQSPEQVAADIKDLERQMKEAAGGAKERARIAGLIEERKEQQRQLAENQTNENNTPTPGGDVKTSKQTMVSWDVQSRDAYQNNKWYVRNPGYVCDNSARETVYVNVKVGADGYVISAVYDATKSSGSSCTIAKALEYAKISRFEYKASAGTESGWIKYIFMSKSN